LVIRARGSILLGSLRQVLRKTGDQGLLSPITVDSSRVSVWGLEIDRKLDRRGGSLAVWSARASTHKKLFNGIQIVKLALFQSREGQLRDVLEKTRWGRGGSPKAEGQWSCRLEIRAAFSSNPKEFASL
jgi:hypothetical protein